MSRRFATPQAQDPRFTVRHVAYAADSDRLAMLRTVCEKVTRTGEASPLIGFCEERSEAWFEERRQVLTPVPDLELDELSRVLGRARKLVSGIPAPDDPLLVALHSQRPSSGPWWTRTRRSAERLDVLLRPSAKAKPADLAESVRRLVEDLGRPRWHRLDERRSPVQCNLPSLFRRALSYALLPELEDVGMGWAGTLITTETPVFPLEELLPLDWFTGMDADGCAAMLPHVRGTPVRCEGPDDLDELASVVHEEMEVRLSPAQLQAALGSQRFLERNALRRIERASRELWVGVRRYEDGLRTAASQGYSMVSWLVHDSDPYAGRGGTPTAELGFPPLPRHASFHAGVASKLAEQRGLKLDGRVETLLTVDLMVQDLRNRHLRATEATKEVYALGFYLGELVIRELGGRWEQGRSRDLEPPAISARVDVPGLTTFDPIGTVIRRLEYGQDHSVVSAVRRLINSRGA